MAITSADVEKIALLARLRLTAAELDAMTRQLSQIVDYVEQLSTAPTDNVEPMAHAVEQFNVFAEDVPHVSLTCEEALSNAPQADEECFLVPAVLG